MPKVKTTTAAEKRLKITKTGKMIRRRQNSRHLRSAKTKQQVRRMKEPTTIYKGFAKKLKKLF